MGIKIKGVVSNQYQLKSHLTQGEMAV